MCKLTPKELGEIEVEPLMTLKVIFEQWVYDHIGFDAADLDEDRAIRSSVVQEMILKLHAQIIERQAGYPARVANDG